MTVRAAAIGGWIVFKLCFLAIISLPHEIQRNLTMIKEHDSLVQGKRRQVSVECPCSNVCIVYGVLCIVGTTMCGYDTILYYMLLYCYTKIPISLRHLDVEKDLFKDVNEFMSLQSKEKEIPSEERIALIKRIKNSFLNTLTHCEEKVSLSNQCYNTVQ